MGSMQVNRIITDLPVSDVAAASVFYRGFLGLDVEQFNLGWVARFVSPETGAEVQLVAEDATAPVSPIASVLVEDVDAAFEEAQRLGVEIVHPLTREPWGVRRFFVRDPAGNVLNIVHHPA